MELLERLGTFTMFQVEEQYLKDKHDRLAAKVKAKKNRLYELQRKILHKRCLKQYMTNKSSDNSIDEVNVACLLTGAEDIKLEEVVLDERWKKAMDEEIQQIGRLLDEAIEMMNKQRVELEELKKEVLEKEEKASSVLEPDGEEDEDVEKNPMKMLAKIVEKSPKVKNELVKVIEKSSITKSVKALKRSTKVLERLKFLNLSHSKYLRETPDFSRLPSLERLILKDCPSLCKVHPSIGHLYNLLLINLKDCTSLSSLPKELYKLKSLRTFILSGCFKIDILEEDIVQMESLITLVTENTVVKQVPCSIVSSKSIAYICLRRFEGLAKNIFPSIIGSWMPPTMNHQYYNSLVCMDMENYTWGDLAPLYRGLANLRSVLVQCNTKFQLYKEVKTILIEYLVNFTESRISSHHLRFSLIGFGSYNKLHSTLSDSISEGMASSESCEVSLPGGWPIWVRGILFLSLCLRIVT
ncbi:disease resistance protein RPV1-like [Vigna angularis]|uniref:disease resistance protein RPV1-like n=1 Tax=Phaseolus angularis TaxID=3914 RepID=UPI0022B5D0FE|nr:disease resistance protein RPV1-like [Vigna angularis]